MDYCLIKDGVVVNIIVADEVFAQSYAASNSMTFVARGELPVAIGNKYHDDKFWRDVFDMDAEGNTLETTHEEEVVVSAA